MNPVKLLASRNLLIGIAVVTVAFVAFVLLQSRSGAASDTMPSAERFSAPPAATGEVVPLDTILTAFKQSRSTAVRKYRESPFTTVVDAVIPVKRNGWGETAVVGGQRATLYFSETQWQSASPPIAPAQLRTFICADWQSAAAGTVTMYGCTAIAAP